MPVYSTKAKLILIYGLSETTVASDHDATGSSDDDAITAALQSASREIEGYAEPYGVVPAGAATALATAGTFPAWWEDACNDIAFYRLSLSAGPMTKEKAARYKHWTDRLDAVYPSILEDGDIPIASTQEVAIVGAGREFSSTKVVGL